MYYEINVSLNGKHYFATAERSIDSEQHARKLFEEFCTKFPEDEGYEIRVSRYETRGHTVYF